MSQDFLDITSCVYKYSYGIDTRDWELYRSIFVEQIRVDFSSYNGVEPSTIKADDWVSNLQPLFMGLDSSQHQMSNPLVEIDGDKARCRMYVQAEHFFQTSSGDPDYALGGHYDNTLIKTDKNWLINSVTLNVFWNRGNPDIMNKARKKGTEILKRDR